MMKKGIIYLIGLAILSTGCVKEGPLGPQGTAGINGANGTNGTKGVNGTNGKDGADGTATCSQCHNDDMKIVAYQMQYNQSMHAKMGFEYPGVENNAKCAGCHTNEGFNKRVADGSFDKLPADGFQNATPISCYTCHSIHKTFSSGDFALKSASLLGSLTLLVNPNISLKLGNSNNCISCHQSSAYSIANLPIAAASDSISITSEDFGPHYGTQGNLYAGIGKSGAFELSGSTLYKNTMHQTILTNACISCHMGNNSMGIKGGGHSLSTKFSDNNTSGDPWNYKSCLPCHIDATTVSKIIADSRDGVDTLRDQLETILMNKGWIKNESRSGYNSTKIVVKASSSKPLTVSALQAKVIYNYLFLKADHSGAAIHNFPYAKALVSNSLEIAKTW